MSSKVLDTDKWLFFPLPYFCFRTLVSVLGFLCFPLALFEMPLFAPSNANSDGEDPSEDDCTVCLGPVILFCQQYSKTYCRECNTRRHCRLPDHQFVRLSQEPLLTFGLDYEFLFLVRVVGSFPYKIAHVTVGKVSWIRGPGNLSSSD